PRSSRFTIVPAPWCGSPPLSPILYKLTLPLLRLWSRRTPTAPKGCRRTQTGYQNRRKSASFAGVFRENPCSGDLLAESEGERAAHGLRLEGRTSRPGRGEHRGDAELPALVEPAVGLRRGPQAAGEADLAEDGEPFAERHPPRGRGERERDPEVRARLVDPHAAGDVDEDVGGAERQPGVPREHGDDDREPLR